MSSADWKIPDLDLVDERFRPTTDDPDDVAEDMAKFPTLYESFCRQHLDETSAAFSAVRRLVGEEHPATIAYGRVGNYWAFRVARVQQVLDEEKRRVELSKMDKDDCNRFEAGDVHDAAVATIAMSPSLGSVKRKRSSMDACKDLIAEITRRGDAP